MVTLYRWEWKFIKYVEKKISAIQADQLVEYTIDYTADWFEPFALQ